MARTVVINDVPEDSVDQVIADFESEGASASMTRQPDGKFTVTAVFPDD
jgi:hypothetical protein